MTPDQPLGRLAPPDKEMHMEITNEMVGGYIGAVATALGEAGHRVNPPIIGRDEPHAELILPDAAPDAFGTAGLSLSWASVLGWTAAYYAVDTRRRSAHTDLMLGMVPEPALVVRAVEAIGAAPTSLKAGRVGPGTAELLAQYAGGKAPEATPLDLITATEQDDGFGYCIGCGATEVAHRALYVSALDGASANTVCRVAWCAAPECEEDRVRSAVQTVPVTRTDEGGYRVADAW